MQGKDWFCFWKTTCKGWYKAGDGAKPCSEGLVAQDNEQVVSPEVPLPEIPRPEAGRQSIPQLRGRTGSAGSLEAA